jgi:hypothetical protein
VPKEIYFSYIMHPLHTDMPNSEKYVKGDEVKLMFSIIKLEISKQKYGQFHVQQPITSRMSSHSCAI